MVKALAFAVPGELTIPTGGYGYARRMIAELNALGWDIHLLNLSIDFPWPTALTRARANAVLGAVPGDWPLVIDGLAYGVLADIAEKLGETHRLVALVHHPLALESGLAAEQSAALHACEETALRFARHVIASSCTTKRLLVSDFNVPAERVSVVSPGTDPYTARARTQSAHVRLLAVGSVVPRKGYDLLVAALARLRDLPWTLLIVGDCSRSPEIVQQLECDIARLNLSERVVLRGAVSSDEIGPIYDAADVFVLPSRYEGYGMAYAEAVAHGLPVIGTMAGAVPETVPEGAGILVPPDDIDALACALHRLIESPTEREKLAAAARSSRFPSWREQGARFSQLLERL